MPTATLTDGSTVTVESEMLDEGTGALIGVWTVHGRYVRARDIAEYVSGNVQHHGEATR